MNGTKTKNERISKAIFERPIMNISQQRLKEIASIPDEKIDTSDIPELDDDFWKDARLIIPESKKLIHFCIERDVFE